MLLLRKRTYIIEKSRPRIQSLDRDLNLIFIYGRQGQRQQTSTRYAVDRGLSSVDDLICFYCFLMTPSSNILSSTT
jgi:hypothetical protein